MNRRGFLLRAASLLPVPAFVRAASLWLPQERPRIELPKFTLIESPFVPHGTAYMYSHMLWLNPKMAEAVKIHIEEHARLIGINNVVRGVE